LKLLVDRVDSPSEDAVGNIDLNQTLLSLTKFMDRFNERSYLRVKVKFCSFCENALSSADVFGLRKDDLVRNNLVEVVADWIEPEASLRIVAFRVEC
jgi:neurofibromin 1